MALIRPFVPAKDFALSQSFYRAMGFDCNYSDENIAVFEYDGSGFLLQNYYVRAFAENCMIQLVVTDLDSWWQRTEGLVEQFAISQPVAPAMQPWGLRVGFLADPSGILWHVTQA